MSGTGRTTAEVRQTDGKTVCFGTLPPYKPGVPKGTLDGVYLGLPVKFRWDRLGTDTVSGILFLSEAAVATVKNLPEFEPAG